jgi:hypothetical protein
MRYHLSSSVSSLGVGLALVVLGACVESTSYTPEPPSVPAPRLPMNNAYVGSVHTGPLRPLFRWEPATSKAAGMISYQLQLSADSKFETDVTSIETTETTYQPEADLPVSLAPPVGARYFWRLRSCLRGACSEYSRPWYINLGRVIKDYNGDGYSDVAVGAPGSDSYLRDAGRVFVYFGGPGRMIDGTPDVLIGSYAELNEGGRMGYNVKGVGDINGDGFADLMWARPSTPSDRTAVAYLHLGGAGSSFDSLPDSLFSIGNDPDRYGPDVGGLGDLNGDGFGDLYITSSLDAGAAVRADIFLGNAGTRIDAKADGSLPWFRPTPAGDVNCDGTADIIVGDPYDGTGGFNAGAAHLYMGGNSEDFDAHVDATLVGRGYFDLFGTGVSSAGDINGDGCSDVIVGNSRNNDNGGGKSGAVDLFLGGPGDFNTVSDSMLKGTVGNDSFGETMTGVSDVNGDGFSDVLIGARASNIGDPRAYLYLGNEGTSLNVMPDAIFVMLADVNYLGGRFAEGGDLNGDGYGDIAFSAEESSQGLGRVDIFLGAPGNAFDISSDTTLSGAAIGDAFGAGLALLPVSLTESVAHLDIRSLPFSRSSSSEHPPYFSRGRSARYNTRALRSAIQPKSFSSLDRPTTFSTGDGAVGGSEP